MRLLTKSTRNNKIQGQKGISMSSPSIPAAPSVSSGAETLETSLMGQGTTALLDREESADEYETESEYSTDSSEDESVDQNVHTKLRDLLFRCGTCGDEVVNDHEGIVQSRQSANENFNKMLKTSSVDACEEDVKTVDLEKDSSSLAESQNDASSPLKNVDYDDSLIDTQMVEVTRTEEKIWVNKPKQVRKQWLPVMRKPSKAADDVNCKKRVTVRYFINSGNKESKDDAYNHIASEQMPLRI